MKKIKSLILLSPLTLLIFSTCKKNKLPSGGCIVPAVAPMQSYSFPVWHPNAQVLGFNHTPMAGISANGNAPCTWYYYSGKPDSTGFYIMNKNGTGFKRITTYNLFAPAWSPDGNWLAFTLGANIYKMRYTGNGFDTANMVQLTNAGGNFHPHWTANSDSIYYDSNITLPTGTSFYTIWKMTSDGIIKHRIVDATGIGDVRFPFIGSDNKVYHARYISGQPEIFAMRNDGSLLQQITINGKNGNRDTPKFVLGNLYYNDNGNIRKINNTGQDVKLIFPAVTYDVSTVGEIVYSKMDFELNYDKQKGTLWIMNGDGSNNRQLTFNNF